MVCVQDSIDGSQDGIDSDGQDDIDSDAAHDATHADQDVGHIVCVPVHAPEPKRAKATAGHAPGVQRTIRSFFAPK